MGKATDELRRLCMHARNESRRSHLAFANGAKAERDDQLCRILDQINHRLELLEGNTDLAAKPVKGDT